MFRYQRSLLLSSPAPHISDLAVPTAVSAGCSSRSLLSRSAPASGGFFTSAHSGACFYLQTHVHFVVDLL